MRAHVQTSTLRHSRMRELRFKSKRVWPAPPYACTRDLTARGAGAIRPQTRDLRSGDSPQTGSDISKRSLQVYTRTRDGGSGSVLDEDRSARTAGCQQAGRTDRGRGEERPVRTRTMV